MPDEWMGLNDLSKGPAAKRDFGRRPAFIHYSSCCHQTFTMYGYNGRSGEILLTSRPLPAVERLSANPVETPEEASPPLEPARKYPGALIVVEGIDGSGKSTQLYLLKRWLEIGGYRLHFTEWNSSPLVKSATRRGKQRRLLTPTTFSLLHAADFADRCERQIMPLLQGDYLVL